MAYNFEKTTKSEATYAMLEGRLRYWVGEAESFLAQREKDSDEEEFMKRVLLSSRTEFAAYRGIRCKEKVTELEERAERLLIQIEGSEDILT